MNDSHFCHCQKVNLDDSTLFSQHWAPAMQPNADALSTAPAMQPNADAPGTCIVLQTLTCCALTSLLLNGSCRDSQH
eukprot:1158366-Pelagomonas_calceolata.AAC.2